MKKITAWLLAVLMILFCLPISVMGADDTNCTISVKSTSAMPNTSVNVEIGIENNPGIQGATLTLTWDDGLTLTSASNGDALKMLNMTPPGRFVSGRSFVWYRDTMVQDEEIKDGTILTLTFAVSSEALEGESFNINVSYTAGDIFDKNLQPLSPAVKSGKITVVTYKPGDVDHNERLNAMDLVLLSRYIADGCTTDPEGYNVSLNPVNAGDVNNDGRLNAMDLVLISRYIADGCMTDPEGYNVTLLPSNHYFDHTHTIAFHAAKASSCTEEGNIAYWYCSECHRYYSDAAATAEITLASTKIALTDHEYINGKCKHCGAKKPSMNTPTFEISNTTASAGAGDAAITVALKSNPGISSLGLDIAFDSALTLTSVEYNTAMGGQAMQPASMGSPAHLTWLSPLANVNGDWTFATLHFAVSEDASVGKHAITLTYDEDNVYDLSEENIFFDTVNGYIEVTAESQQENKPTFEISNTTANAGATDVAITVALKNNPGISSLGLDIAFDSALTLTSVDYNTAMGGQAMQPASMGSPAHLTWLSPLANVNGDWTFATLHFAVSSTASAGKHAITLTYDEDNVYDLSEENIFFDTVNGYVEVTK